jgi:hypothetical protein
VTFPVTQVAGDERGSAKWNDLPAVSSVNSVRQAKLGRRWLLTGVDNRKAGSDRPRLPALRARQGDRDADQDSWLWRMDAKIAVTDTTTRCSGGG